MKDKNINICFLNGDMSRSGGTERSTTLIANELSKKGFNVKVLSLRNVNKRSFFSLVDTVKHDVLIPEIKSKIQIPKIILLLNKYLRKNNIDILINVDVMLGIYSIPASCFTKTKLIAWEHFNFYQDIGCKYTKYIRRLSVKLCDHYIVLTARDKKNFEENLKIKCPIDYIYNPITYTVGHEYSIDSKIIMSVGNLLEIKGFDMLIDVAHQVLKENKGWQWHIYGEGPKREELQDKINYLGLQDKVILKGRVNNIEEYYPKAAIFVMTSRMEGLPMTLLEAKANKLPIVSFDIMTGPSEIIDEGINGYLIKPYSIEEMSKRIYMLIQDVNLRKNMSDNSIMGIEKFNIKSIINKWEGILRRI